MRSNILLVALAAATSMGCPWVRETALTAAPNVPAPSGCTLGDQRCNGAVPEVCSGSGRWYPSLPTHASGAPRNCAGGCVRVELDGGGPVAYCAPVAAVTDGGAL